MEDLQKDLIEKKFIAALSMIPEKSKLLLAVSGGADSIAMLSLFSEFARLRQIEFFVASVNHNLRPEKESLLDIELVESQCKNYSIPCFTKTAHKGEIKNLSLSRKKGLEEAARFFRYDFFHSLAKEKGADYIVTAHNKNDHLETLLARFLQGSLVGSGISMLWDSYFKPLLDCSREEIEGYLEKKMLRFSIDKTNNESIFFRNKIRNILSPFLDEHFFGWKKALLNGAKKRAIDEHFFARYLDRLAFDFIEDKAFFSEKDFYELDPALQIRLLYKTFSALSLESRISFAVIESILLKEVVKTDEISVSFSAGNIFIEKQSKKAKKKNFFAIVEKECKFLTNYATISISSVDGEYKTKLCSDKKVQLPFILSYVGEKLTKTKIHKKASEEYMFCFEKK